MFFAYFFKKVTPSKNSEIISLSWSNSSGWLAVGCRDGILKVLNATQMLRGTDEGGIGSKRFSAKARLDSYQTHQLQTLSAPPPVSSAPAGGGSPPTEEEATQTSDQAKPFNSTHNGDVHLVMWAEEEGTGEEDIEGERILRLSSADQSGCIAIWKQQPRGSSRLRQLHAQSSLNENSSQPPLHHQTAAGGTRTDEGGGWITELINVDHKKQIAFTAWSSDGLKVCIVYTDGNLILGHVSGERLWSKDLRRSMIYAAWSPDNKKLLLVSKTGEMFFYTADGLYSHRLRTQLGDDEEGRSEPLIPVAGIHWYMNDVFLKTRDQEEEQGKEGGEGRDKDLDRRSLREKSANRQSVKKNDKKNTMIRPLAIAYITGCIQLYQDDLDEKPLTFDSYLQPCLSIQWNPIHPILAVYGRTNILHPAAHDLQTTHTHLSHQRRTSFSSSSSSLSSPPFPRPTPLRSNSSCSSSSIAITTPRHQDHSSRKMSIMKSFFSSSSSSSSLLEGATGGGGGEEIKNPKVAKKTTDFTRPPKGTSEEEGTTTTEGNAYHHVIRFYYISRDKAEYLYTLKLPNCEKATVHSSRKEDDHVLLLSPSRTFSWDDSGRYLAMACRNAILFAKIRLRQLATYFNETLVYYADDVYLPMSTSNSKRRSLANPLHHSKASGRSAKEESTGVGTGNAATGGGGGQLAAKNERRKGKKKVFGGGLGDGSSSSSTHLSNTSLAIWFWNRETGSKHLRNIKASQVLHIKSCRDCCLLVTMLLRDEDDEDGAIHEREKSLGEKEEKEKEKQEDDGDDDEGSRCQKERREKGEDEEKTNETTTSDLGKTDDQKASMNKNRKEKDTKNEKKEEGEQQEEEDKSKNKTSRGVERKKYTYALCLYNHLGEIMKTVYTDIDPLHAVITETHVIIADETRLHIWRYKDASASLLSSLFKNLEQGSVDEGANAWIGEEGKKEKEGMEQKKQEEHEQDRSDDNCDYVDSYYLPILKKNITRLIDDESLDPSDYILSLTSSSSSSPLSSSLLTHSSSQQHQGTSFPGDLLPSSTALDWTSPVELTIDISQHTSPSTTALRQDRKGEEERKKGEERKSSSSRFHGGDSTPYRRAAAETFSSSTSTTTTIVSLDARGENSFFLALKNGEIRRYSLPYGRLEEISYLDQTSHPLYITLNANSTRLAVIDIHHVLRLYSVDTRGPLKKNNKKKLSSSSSSLLSSASTDARHDVGNSHGGGEIEKGTKREEEKEEEQHPSANDNEEEEETEICENSLESFLTTLRPSLNFERRDVSDVLWSSDECDLFAFIEKGMLYIARGLSLEEPISMNESSFYLGELRNLKLQAFYLDELLRTPGEPHADLHSFQYDTKALRDIKDILEKANEIHDAVVYAEKSASHPCIWRCIATKALSNFDLDTAEKAFINCQDYSGIQFVNRLRVVDCEKKRKAEILAYLGDIDGAESIYLSLDRRDLAFQLRASIGDWSRVLELSRDTRLSTASSSSTCFSTSSSTSSSVRVPSPPPSGVCTLGGTSLDRDFHYKATKALGDSCRDEGVWGEAIEAYRSIRDYSSLIEAYFITEQYDELNRLVTEELIQETDGELLKDIGKKLVSVGLYKEAVHAYTKGRWIEEAIDCCIKFNAWDTAMSIAENTRSHQLETLLTKCGGHYIERRKYIQAIQLYLRAGSKALESSKLLIHLANTYFFQGKGEKEDREEKGRGGGRGSVNEIKNINKTKSFHGEEEILARERKTNSFPDPAHHSKSWSGSECEEKSRSAYGFDFEMHAMNSMKSSSSSSHLLLSSHETLDSLLLTDTSSPLLSSFSFPFSSSSFSSATTSSRPPPQYYPHYRKQLYVLAALQVEKYLHACASLPSKNNDTSTTSNHPGGQPRGSTGTTAPGKKKKSNMNGGLSSDEETKKKKEEEDQSALSSLDQEKRDEGAVLGNKSMRTTNSTLNCALKPLPSRCLSTRLSSSSQALLSHTQACLNTVLLDQTVSPATLKNIGGGRNTNEEMTRGEKEKRLLYQPWKGAEAFHLYLLAHRQLIDQAFDSAVCTCVRLVHDYEDYIDLKTSNCLLALASFYAKNFRLCSKAFMYLENSQEIPEDQREIFSELAIEIFTRHPPVDSRRQQTRLQDKEEGEVVTEDEEVLSCGVCTCPKCKASIHYWETACSHCYTHFYFCVASGKSILNEILYTASPQLLSYPRDPKALPSLHEEEGEKREKEEEENQQTQGKGERSLFNAEVTQEEALLSSTLKKKEENSFASSSSFFTLKPIADFTTCKTCHHKMLTSEIHRIENCPLCHTPLSAFILHQSKKPPRAAAAFSE